MPTEAMTPHPDVRIRSRLFTTNRSRQRWRAGYRVRMPWCAWRRALLVVVAAAVPAFALGAEPPFPRDDAPRPLPVAIAGPDLSTHVFEAVTIDGSHSHDAAPPASTTNERLITFHWTIVQAPSGSVAAIETAAPAPVFVPDVAGAYVLQLVVVAQDGARSVADAMTLTAFAGNAAPVALVETPRG
jgi:hypothetical protein